MCYVYNMYIYIYIYTIIVYYIYVYMYMYMSVCDSAARRPLGISSRKHIAKLLSIYPIIQLSI